MDAALRKRLKDLELRAVRLVSSRFLGEWASNVRGQGLEFRDLREYVVGDDVRRLDWKATARSGKPQLRRFTEDRQQTIWIAVDLSASMMGDKRALCQEIVAVLGWTAVKQNDRFGLLGFSDRLELHREPGRGSYHLWTSLEELVSFAPSSRRTDFTPLWDFLSHRAGHRSTVIILSDFWAGLDQRAIGALARRHEVLALQVLDAKEFGQVPGGLCLVEDAETGGSSWVDLSSRRMNGGLKSATEADRLRSAAQLRKAGVWYTWLSTKGDWLADLTDFFHRRTEVVGV